MSWSFDIYRLLVNERITQYLGEAARDRFAKEPETLSPPRRSALGGWWDIVVGALMSKGHERGTSCADAGRRAS
jgi:hypothetical protein